jgi:hypothetical protein
MANGVSLGKAGIRGNTGYASISAGNSGGGGSHGAGGREGSGGKGTSQSTSKQSVIDHISSPTINSIPTSTLINELATHGWHIQVGRDPKEFARAVKAFSDMITQRIGEGAANIYWNKVLNSFKNTRIQDQIYVPLYDYKQSFPLLDQSKREWDAQEGAKKAEEARTELQKKIDVYESAMGDADKKTIENAIKTGNFDGAIKYLDKYVRPKAARREEEAKKERMVEAEYEKLKAKYKAAMEGGEGEEGISEEIDKLPEGIKEEVVGKLAEYYMEEQEKEKIQEENLRRIEEEAGYKKEPEKAGVTFRINNDEGLEEGHRLSFMKDFVEKDAGFVYNKDLKSLVERMESPAGRDILLDMGVSPEEIEWGIKHIKDNMEATKERKVARRAVVRGNIPIKTGYRFNPNTKATLETQIGVGPEGIRAGGNDQYVRVGLSHKFGGGKKGGQEGSMDNNNYRANVEVYREWMELPERDKKILPFDWGMNAEKRESMKEAIELLKTNIEGINEGNKERGNGFLETWGAKGKEKGKEALGWIKRKGSEYVPKLALGIRGTGGWVLGKAKEQGSRIAAGIDSGLNWGIGKAIEKGNKFSGWTSGASGWVKRKVEEGKGRAEQWRKGRGAKGEGEHLGEELPEGVGGGIEEPVEAAALGAQEKREGMGEGNGYGSQGISEEERKFRINNRNMRAAIDPFIRKTRKYIPHEELESLREKIGKTNDEMERAGLENLYFTLQAMRNKQSKSRNPWFR